MAELLGASYTKRQIMERFGDLSQIGGIREGVLTSGRADGMRVLDVRTGSGLEFSVFPSRALDIGWASYQEKPISFISKSGPTKPEFYEKDGRSFLRSFACGLLTSCGMTQMGTPCQDGGENLGLHGRLSNLPAYQVSTQQAWEGDECLFHIKGKIRESRVFGENLELSRHIFTKLGSTQIEIHDEVENQGFETAPLMLLYHINFGYPLVSGDTRLYFSGPTHVNPRDEAAQAGLEQLYLCQEPTPGFQEQVFFHQLSNASAFTVCLYNHRLDFGAALKVRPEELPSLCQWKMMGQGDYVMGLEPCTCPPIGRVRAREQGILPFLEPGEKREFHLEIRILRTPQELE